MPRIPSEKLDRNRLRRLHGGTLDQGTESGSSASGVEETIARTWAELLMVDHVGVDEDFLDSGGDSISLARLASRVSDHFEIDLAVSTVLEAGTVARLAREVEARRRAEARSHLKLPQDRQSLPDLGAGRIDLEAEPTLDPEIRGPIAAPPCGSGGVSFLTGATGFLGAHILCELLDQTSGSVYCLVRAKSIEEARGRLRESLNSRELSARGFDRVQPVLGDLAQPRLGLSEPQFSTLADQVDVVYHCGALVNHVFPYSTLRLTNVRGTEEVLRLVALGRPKSMHHVSSAGIFRRVGGAVEHRIEESESIDEYASRLYVAYHQSKWVAERLVGLAAKRGIPVSIFRPAYISGHSGTGVSSIHDTAVLFLKLCIQLGLAPDHDVRMDFAPVDYVSRAIVFISRRVAATGDVFHLFNPPVPFGHLVDWMRSFGYPLEYVSHPDWVARVRQGKDDLSRSFIALRGDTWLIEGVNLDCKRTLGALNGSGVVCPPTSAKLMERYFSYFIRSGIIAAPRRSESTGS